MIIPFLGLLFGTQELVTTAPPLAMDTSSLVDNFYYQLSKIIAPDGVIHPEGQLHGLMVICFLVLTLFFLKNMFRYFALYFLSPIRYGVVRDIRKEVYKKLLALPLGFYSERRKGDVIARMTTDILEIEVSIMNSFEVLFKDPLTIIAFLIAMILMSPQLTIFVLILLPIAGFFIGKVGKSLKKISVIGQDSIGRLISLVEETLSGIRIIKAFTAEKRSAKKFDSANDTTMAIFVRLLRKRDMSAPMSEFLGVGVMVIVMWFGGKLVLDVDMILAPEVFIAYIAIFSQIISPSKSFATAYYNIQKGAASLDRIADIMDAEETIKDLPDAKSISSFEGAIEYKKVCFSYEKAPVIRNIDMHITKGKTIALVGQSGGGKTTIANLLPRFYDLTEGDILIDGFSLKSYKLEDLRKLMGIVTQDSILFHDTVLNNIAFGVDVADEEDVIQAAKIANAHDFIMKLENGYATNIGDGGGKLSGGQRQRLSIARAILKNPPILILDEATSALDTESEKMVQEAIFNLMKNRTSIVIAHRLSTIKNADEILVIHEGAIVERGTHNELISQKGTYYKLYELQAFS
jgi:subfamily B ATP-binding cassette protein MsbA